MAVGLVHLGVTRPAAGRVPAGQVVVELAEDPATPARSASTSSAPSRSRLPAFAMQGGDKFAGCRWPRRARVADPRRRPCVDRLRHRRVHEAGDHYIVIGRVRELDIGTPALPLVFFQGGYGRFTSLSHRRVGERPRRADAVRGPGPPVHGSPSRRACRSSVWPVRSSVTRWCSSLVPARCGRPTLPTAVGPGFRSSRLWARRSSPGRPGPRSAPGSTRWARPRRRDSSRPRAHPGRRTRSRLFGCPRPPLAQGGRAGAQRG